MFNLKNNGKYFPFIDYNQDSPYNPKPIVYEKTKELANLFEYEMRYWMQYYIFLFTPSIFPRVCNAFGYMTCWWELRYFMEHATYDPEHPLYNLDYEVLTASSNPEDIENLHRLDLFIELSKLKAWYPFVKRDRPNLLPRKERKPLTRKEEQFLRWMPLVYSHKATSRIVSAWCRNFSELHKIYSVARLGTDEEIAEWDEYQEYLAEEERRKRREARWERKRLGLIQKKQRK